MSARPDDTPTIRRMTLSDLDSVIAIEREVFLFPGRAVISAIPSMRDTIAWYWIRKVIFLVTG